MGIANDPEPESGWAGQNCISCALYQGKPADKAGGCPLFGARQVAGAGWCSAWAKRA